MCRASVILSFCRSDAVITAGGKSKRGPGFRSSWASPAPGVGWPAQTIDEDVEQAQHARLPAGVVVQVANADQGPQEVLRADIGTDLACRDHSCDTQAVFELCWTHTSFRCAYF